MASADRVGYESQGPQYPQPEKASLELIHGSSPPYAVLAEPLLLPSGQETYSQPPPETSQTYYPPPPDKVPSYQEPPTPAPSASAAEPNSASTSYFPKHGIYQPPAWNATSADHMPPTPAPSLPPFSPVDTLQQANQAFDPATPTPPESAVSERHSSIPSLYPTTSHASASYPEVLVAPSEDVVPHPPRPSAGVHHYTEPYIAPAHPLSEQGPGMATPQYAHPYSLPLRQGSQASIAAPELPLKHSTTLPDLPGSSTPDVQQAVVQPAHDVKNHGVKRFVGNMVYVRAARSSVQTVVSSAKLPFYLSPWGDNNPVTLPNIRKRDVAFFGLAFFGLEALAPGMVEMVGPLIVEGTKMTTEAAADEAVAKMTKGKAPIINANAGTVSMQLRISHKLIGQEASLAFMDERDNTENRADCSKGWFCPYLYASCRLPKVPRAKDFAVAQFYGPGLAADAAIAPIMLSALQDGYRVAAVCPTVSPCLSHPPFRRMAILFMGLSPFRTAGAWSQSRIPNEARLGFHLLTHIPSIVVPVKATAPVCAWSPWTMKQMLYNTGGYDSDKHYYEVLAFLETIVDEAGIDEEKKGDWRQVVSEGLGKIIKGVRDLDTTLPSSTGSINMERAGIAMFRF